MAYTPNKAIHPGYVLAQSLEREGMTQKSLSDRTGLTEKHISQIINGEASITVETALLLENALGGTADFWNSLEKNYQATKARIERVSSVKKEITLLPQFPYAELAKRKYVQTTRIREEKVQNLWKFFGLNSLENVQKIQAAAYRKREVNTKKDQAIATWLRCGEIDAKDITPRQFSESTLKQSLHELRLLTNKEPEEYSKSVKEILSKSGIALVYVPHFKGTGVSGAVRWLGERPIIQLSLLGTYADIFWFNLFHEIGHIIRHGKKERFIEFEKPLVDEKEKEANSFAAEALIPKAEYDAFLGADEFTKDAVNKFAHQLQIHPGIIEGRLMHDRKMDWKNSLGFRSQLRFADRETI